MSVNLVCDAITKTDGYTMYGFSIHVTTDSYGGGAKMAFVPDKCTGGDNNPLLEHGVAVGKNGVVIVPDTYTDVIHLVVSDNLYEYSVNIIAGTEVPVGVEMDMTPSGDDGGGGPE